jgi:hypothetical protein
MANANNVNGTPKAQVVFTEAPGLNTQTGLVGTAGGTTPVFIGGPKGTGKMPGSGITTKK